MFNNDAYMTRGFQSEIPAISQGIIYECLEKAKHALKEMDYFQVFELRKIRSDGVCLQEIIHFQEVPAFKETHVLELPESQIIETKVYAIDDGTHHTFLLASEY